MAGDERAYGLLFEHTDSMVCTLDLSGRFTSVNRAGERLTGYRADELVGRFAAELIAPELRDEAARQFQRRLSALGDHPPQESVLVARDGRRVPIEVTSAIVEDGGRPLGVLGVVRDLTAVKSAENALLESEERFRLAFQHAGIGMALVAPDGRFLQVNGALCELVGYSADELVAMTFQEITHPDDLEASLELVRQALAGQSRAFQQEKRYVHKAGGAVWGNVTVTLVRDRDGAPLYFIAQIQDVTERKAAEDELARSEARLAEAQHLAGIGSWHWDVEADAVTWSAELYRMFGVDPAVGNLSYDTYLETLHPADRDFVDGVVREAFASGRPFEIEHRLLLPDGAIRWVHGRGEVEQHGGRTVRMQGTAQDVTQRKDAEERLREAEERYRTLVEQLPLVTYVRPMDMRLPHTYVSPQAERILGYPVESWLTDPDLLARAVHPDDRDKVFADAEHVRRTGQPLRQEYRYVTPDGRVVWGLDETHVVHDEHGVPQCMQGFVLDITDRKLAEEERDRLRDELHHAQKLEALGALAGGVAHDFNNVLTAIRGYSELILDALEPGSPGAREAAQIRRAAEQASVLPRQLLVFSRRQVLEPVLLELGQVVADSVDLLSHVAGEATAIGTLMGAEPAWVYADPGQLQQALLNLVANARDAMPEGGTITISVESASVGEKPAAEQDVVPGDYWVVTVSDTGEGMDAETAERIFEPFFTTKPAGQGSGLGLATVYGIVRQSGGFVTVDSAPGSGSTFELYFPRQDAPAGRESVEASGAPELSAAPATVLLVEDQELVRDAARAVLENAGYRVVTASNGAEALELCEQASPHADVVLTDMVMPVMSGDELVVQLGRRRPGIPVVLMSGYTDEDLTTSESGAAHGFLQKPFSAGELVQAVEAALARGENGNGRTGAGERITCLVADDHPAVLDSVSRFLRGRGIDVVSSILRSDEALQEIGARKPSVALLDISMQPMSGIDVARRVARVSPSTRTVLYTGHRDEALLEQALEAGAHGFVLKDSPLGELAQAIVEVAGGGTYVDPELAAALASSSSIGKLSPLTPREREVLALLADGLTNERVADQLGISPETVQSHVGHAMTKLEADTRTQAVATAIRQSVIA